MARLVAGQQRGDIDIEGQQVADGVLIFGAVEPAEGIGAAGIGMGGGRAVERGFQRGDERVVGALIRAGAVRRAACSARAVCGRLFPRLPGARSTGSARMVSSASPAVFTLALWQPRQ